MRWRWIVTLLLLWSVLWSSVPFAEEQSVALKIKDTAGKQVGLYRGSYALLVGASEYRAGWPKLPGVVSDITLVRKVLEQHGFQVTVVRDPDQGQLRQAFTTFINKHGNAEENRLLFYFAGHGHTLKQAYGGEMGYIVPVDAPNPNFDRNGFLSKALDMQQIEVYARRIQSKHALFLFDSCFSGSIFSLSRAVPEYISYKTAKPVRQFITSGSANETVPDESVFRAEFLSGLEGLADANSDGYVTGTELGEYLQQNVVNYSRGNQHPQYGKIRDRLLDKGDFVFPLVAVKKAEDATERGLKRNVGHLQVNVNTVAEVYVEDQKIGKTDKNGTLKQPDLPVGRIKVRTAAAGFESATRTVQIMRDRWNTVEFDLQALSRQSRLTVRSNVHDDRVYIDGKAKGSTRLDLDLAPGWYTVRVEKEGYMAYEKSVRLGTGDEIVVRARLAKVVVDLPPARIEFFEADRTHIGFGERVRLHWRTAGAEAVEIGGIGRVLPSGFREIEVHETTTFTLMAVNPGGRAIENHLRIEVENPAARIHYFEAFPSHIGTGEVTTLRWETEHAAHVEISGIGVVPSTGDRIVELPEATAFTLFASDDEGRVARKTIHVDVERFSQQDIGGESLSFWINIDPDTQSITRLEIERRDDIVFVHAWSKCEDPEDCDWGVGEGRVIGDTAVVAWDHGFVVHRMEISQPGEHIVAVTVSEFHDPRPAQRSVDYFHPIPPPDFGERFEPSIQDARPPPY